MSRPFTTSCLGKRRFASKDEAEQNAVRTSRAIRARVQPYRCPYCEGWHLTRSNRRKKKSR